MIRSGLSSCKVVLATVTFNVIGNSLRDSLEVRPEKS